MGYCSGIVMTTVGHAMLVMFESGLVNDG